jgi:aspartate oxidase
VRAALRRQESRGAHHRADHRQARAQIERHRDRLPPTTDVTVRGSAPALVRVG